MSQNSQNHYYMFKSDFFVSNGSSSNRKHLYWVSIGFWWVIIALFWAKAPFLGFGIADFEAVVAF